MAKLEFVIANFLFKIFLMIANTMQHFTCSSVLALLFWGERERECKYISAFK